MRAPARRGRPGAKPSTLSRMRNEMDAEEEAEEAVVQDPLPRKRPVPAWGWIVAALLIGACSLIIAYAIYEVWTR